MLSVLKVFVACTNFITREREREREREGGRNTDRVKKERQRGSQADA